jgi:iron complex outermembrane recepter protein
LYAEAARGFRYGGVNNSVPVNFCARQLAELGLSRAPATFGPDHLWSFSLGEKGTFADGRVVVNVNGFYVKWDDVQTTKLMTCGYNFTQNSGKVESQGVELESKVLVTRDFTVGLSGSFTDATTAEPNANLKAAKGDRVPFFPRTIVTLNGEYEVFLPEAKLAFSADYTYRSNQFTDFSPLVFSYVEIPSSVQVNASVAYTRDNWSVSLFGTNLTNNKLINSVNVNTYGAIQPGNIEYWGRPRTIGVHAHLGF